MNMAIDEALLEQTPAPALRCYRWRKPSLSFGYFGRFAEVAEEEGKRDMVRRWTGGGIVLHGADFTYSVIIPAQKTIRIAGPRFIYGQIHDAIRRVLSAKIADRRAQIAEADGAAQIPAVVGPPARAAA